MRDCIGVRHGANSRRADDDEVDRALLHGLGPPVGSANVTIGDAVCRERHGDEGVPLATGYSRAICARPTPSPSSTWSSSIVTLTLTSLPVNSNGAG